MFKTRSLRKLKLKNQCKVNLNQTNSLGCENEGVVYSNQAAACTITCEDPDPACTYNFVSKCQCPDDKPVLHQGRCITSDECPERSTTEEVSFVGGK